MDKIIVAGGAGFIGSNLVDQLIENGEEVVVLDDLSSGKEDYLNPQARFYKADITSEKKIREVFEKESKEKPIDYVFHLAAQIDVRISVKNPEKDNKINLLGGLNILKNCQKYNIKKIVFASTGGAVYGDVEEIPTPETVIPEPVSPYGIHKLAFEKYLNYYYQVFGQDYAVLRLANVYGPRQFKGGEAGVITIFIDNAVNRKPSILYGDGKQTRDFVYVDDVVDAFIKAKDSNFVGVLNIGRGKEASILEVVDLINSGISGKMEVKQEEARSGEQRRSCLDASKVKQILNWNPQTDLKQGILKTIKWSESQKH